MSIFDRIKKSLGGRSDAEADGMRALLGTMDNLARQDADRVARGEPLERRLIPHHAIKRDVIIAAYQKDFAAAISHLEDLGWTNTAKADKANDMRGDFDKHIIGVKQLGYEDLDKIIAEMKRTRRDLKEVEQAVRDQNPMYRIVDPL